MPEKLNRWIGNMIGARQKRENFQIPVSPLFIISTWFNKDMEFDYNDKSGELQSLNERWYQRFIKTLR